MYAFEMDKSLIGATENALPYAFQGGYEEANDELNNASFYFAETV